MEEQLNLFESASKRWVERLWEGVDGERRDAVLAVLAQMALTRLEHLCSARTKEKADES